MSVYDLPGELVVLSMAINVLDRLVTRRPGIFLFPEAGRWRQFSGDWTVLMATVGALALFRVLPLICFITSGARGWSGYRFTPFCSDIFG